MMLSVVVTILAVLYQESKRDPSYVLFEQDLRVSLLVLPGVSAFVLTSITRLNPVNKWAALASGAVHMKSEIYQYRCRVLDYQPRKASSADIEDRVAELCDHPLKASADDHDAEADAAKRRRKKTKAAAAKKVSRRGAFAANLEQINSDATGTDVRGDCLHMPPSFAMDDLLASLYDTERVWKAHLKRTGSCKAFCRELLHQICLRARRQESVDYCPTDNPWIKAGADFFQNPYSVEDEFLKDDGLSLVTAEDYIHFRFLPLLQYYTRRSRALSRMVQTIQAGSV